MSFSYVGSILSSKSLFNRALAIKSFYPELQIYGESQSDDVLKMQRALEAFKRNQIIDCGHAGTVLRFMALRASRAPGYHTLTGSERLLSRPKEELFKTLRQLGCEVNEEEHLILVKSFGWKLLGDGLWVSGNQSSQFISAVLLSAWDLDYDLHINIGNKSMRVSEAYLKMTMHLLSSLGMEIRASDEEIMIPKGQKLKSTRCDIEPDMSSAFAVAALAIVAGEARLLNIPPRSCQPDAVFIEILSSMGVKVSQGGTGLRISRCEKLKPVRLNLSDSPDLFPILAVLCALADGESLINGVEHLLYKESDRISKSKELLELMGARLVVNESDSFNQDSSVKIIPCVSSEPLSQGIVKCTYDPDQDHRMLMAAVIAKAAILSEMKILNPQVVKKSFPEFLSIAQEYL